MKVCIIKESPKTKTIFPGDIIVYDNTDVQVVTEQSINGCKKASVGLNGTMWSSDPQDSVDRGDAILYRQDEYELVLRKRVK